MAGNMLRRNIFYYHKVESNLMRLSELPLDYTVSDYDLAYHFGLPLRIEYSQSVKKEANPKSPDTPTDQWPTWWQAQGQDRHSIVADPLFVDPEHDDYRLRPESPALKLGFRPIRSRRSGRMLTRCEPVGRSSRRKAPARSRWSASNSGRKGHIARSRCWQSLPKSPDFRSEGPRLGGFGKFFRL